MPEWQGAGFGDVRMSGGTRTRPGYPASPCIQVCTLDDAELCQGCRRTLQEIVNWSRLSADEQRAVIAQLPARRSAPAGAAAALE